MIENTHGWVNFSHLREIETSRCKEDFGIMFLLNQATNGCAMFMPKGKV